MNALHRHSGHFHTLAHLSDLCLLKARLLGLGSHHSSKEREPRRFLVGSRAVLKLQVLLRRRLHRS